MYPQGGHPLSLPRIRSFSWKARVSFRWPTLRPSATRSVKMTATPAPPSSRCSHAAHPRQPGPEHGTPSPKAGGCVPRRTRHSRRALEARRAHRPTRKHARPTASPSPSGLARPPPHPTLSHQRERKYTFLRSPATQRGARSTQHAAGFFYSPSPNTPQLAARSFIFIIL